MSAFLSAHIETCKNVCVYVSVCVCVCVLQAMGSPAGPHLLRPDQTMRRGAARSGVQRCAG